MEHIRSSPVTWVGEEHLGFVVNAAFSDENKHVLTTWLEGLREISPAGIYTMKPDSLHITVLDWVAPLFDYDGVNKRALYEDLYSSYNPAFRRITGAIKPFDVHFTDLRVMPGAIILVGQDGGQFQSLRQKFMDSVTLPGGGKQPPNIIHSSLVRFVTPEIDLTPVEAYASSHPIDLTQRISEFRLVETRREPMQDFKIIDAYKLAD
ncbi:MAG TPA: hypothetical protein VNX65_03535 [Patescibacteria group bacterium]|jgi:hypothetical protein|nr:hypothetical protein [Patescibacteria group bacterium]